MVTIIYSMLPAILLANPNYQIRTLPVLDQSISITEQIQEKLNSFDSNIVELGQLFNQLHNQISWRYQRIRDVLRSNSEANSEALVYLIDNRESINKNNSLPTADFLKLIRADQKSAVLEAWNSETKQNQELKSFYFTHFAKIKTILNDKIKNTITPNSNMLEEFSRNEANLFLGPKFYAAVHPDYTEKDYQEFSKTVYFLTHNDKLPRSAEETFHLTYLYLKSTIQYFYNRTLDSSAVMVKKKSGDCNENVFFYYSIQKTLGNIQPEIYIASNSKSPLLHMFGGIKINDLYYIFDDDNFTIGSNFAETGAKHFNSKLTNTHLTISRRDPALLLKFTAQANNKKTTDFIELINSQEISPK